MFALPVAGRLFTPIDFALNGVCLAVVLTGAYAVNGGYDMALMLPHSHAEALALAQRGKQIANKLVLMVLAVALLLWPWSAFWQWIHLPQLQGWHLCIPLALWLEGRLQPKSLLLNRFGDYRALARMRMVRALAAAWVPVLPALVVPHHLWLMAGYLIGQGWALWFTGRVLLRHTAGIELPQNPDFHHEYRDFPRYGVVSNWLNMAAKQLPLLLLPSLAGVQAAGWFERCQKVLLLPVGMVAMPIGEVYFREGSQPGVALGRLTVRTLVQLLALAIVPALALLIWGPDLFGWVLGPAWVPAGEYARWFAPWMMLLFASAPLAYVVDLRRALRGYTWFNVANFAVQLLVLVGWGRWFPGSDPIIAYACIASVGLAGQLAYFMYLAYSQNRTT